MSIFNYLNYKNFIVSKIQRNRHLKGYQGLLSKAAGCQRPYLSQVLNGKAHLSLDHIAGIADFLELSELETDYFIELINFSRAGTQNLKKLIKRRLKRLKDDNENLKLRFQKPSIEDQRYQSTYYSSWHWAAVHVLLSIPEYSTVNSIAKRLGLQPDRVLYILKELESFGLTNKSSRGWVPLDKHIHVSKDSPHHIINHMIWRNKANSRCSESTTDSIFYTGVHSLSKNDYEVIKRKLLNEIDQAHSIVSPSNAEEIICFNLDFFKV